MVWIFSGITQPTIKIIGLTQLINNNLNWRSDGLHIIRVTLCLVELPLGFNKNSCLGARQSNINFKAFWLWTTFVNAQQCTGKETLLKCYLEVAWRLDKKWGGDKFLRSQCAGRHRLHSNYWPPYGTYSHTKLKLDWRLWFERYIL